MKATLVFPGGRERSQWNLFEQDRMCMSTKKELLCIAVSYCTGLENVHQKSMSAQNLGMGLHREIGSLQM